METSINQIENAIKRDRIHLQKLVSYHYTVSKRIKRNKLILATLLNEETVDSEDQENVETDSDDDESSNELIYELSIEHAARRISSYVFYFKDRMMRVMGHKPEKETWEEFVDQVDLNEIENYIEKNGLSKDDWKMLNELTDVTKWDYDASDCINVAEGFHILHRLVNDEDSVYQQYCAALGHLLEYFKEHPLSWQS